MHSSSKLVLDYLLLWVFCTFCTFSNYRQLRIAKARTLGPEPAVSAAVGSVSQHRAF